MAEDDVLLINENYPEVDNVYDVRAPANDDVALVDTREHFPDQRRIEIAPPLPPGKLYHAFFSHSSEDSRWVNNVLERLESHEYGFRCCVADRDFDLGAPVFQNITKSILSSCKTVIVMSPEFLRSQWCSYEAQITMEHDMDMRRRLLIPLMLRECTVPEFIGRVTYIDVNNEHFWPRFIAALQDVQVTSAYDVIEPQGSRARLIAMPFGFNPNFSNGDFIEELTAYNQCECGESEFQACYIPNGLASRGIQIDEIEYADVKRLLSASNYIRWHGLSSLHFAGSAIGLTICATCFAIAFFMTYGVLMLPNSDRAHAFIFPVVWACVVSFSVTIVGILLCVKIAATNRFFDRMRKANNILFRRNIMICSYDRGMCCNCRRTTIAFYYYEWRSCEHQLCDNLLNQQTTRENSDQLLESAHSLLLDHAIEYGQLLVRHRLPTTTAQRHCRQGECLCQFIERILQEPTVNRCEKWLFNTGSRHPWKLLKLL